MSAAAAVPAVCELPDGREIAAVQPAEAQALWREIEGDSPYRQACSGLEPGAAILDIGAHIGLAALCFAENAPDAPVIALEPAPPTFACLRTNLERHAPAARAVCRAVGHEPGTAPFTFRPHMSSMSTLYADQADDRRNLGVFLDHRGTGERARERTWQALAVEEGFEVEVTTVSALLAEYRIERVGLMKIDVERAELDVLDGLAEPDWPRVDRVLVEVHDLDGRLGEVVARLARRGFTVTTSQAPLFRGGSVYSCLAVRD